MDLNKYTGSGSNFLIWAIIIVVALGFGKGSKSLGFLGLKPGSYDTPLGKKGYKGGSTYAKGGYSPNGNLLGSNLFGNNLVFIVVIVVLLLLCKEKKQEQSAEPVASIDYEETAEY